MGKRQLGNVISGTFLRYTNPHIVSCGAVCGLTLQRREGKELRCRIENIYLHHLAYTSVSLDVGI